MFPCLGEWLAQTQPLILLVWVSVFWCLREEWTLLKSPSACATSEKTWAAYKQSRSLMKGLNWTCRQQHTSVSTAATWKCFLLCLHQFTTLNLWTVSPFSDLRLRFVNRHTGELRFTAALFECVPPLPQHARLQCQGDCRLPAEQLFMAFESFVRS